MVCSKTLGIPGHRELEGVDLPWRVFFKVKFCQSYSIQHWHRGPQMSSNSFSNIYVNTPVSIYISNFSYPAYRVPLHQVQNTAGTGGDPKRRFPLSGSSDEVKLMFYFHFYFKVSLSLFFLLSLASSSNEVNLCHGLIKHFTFT